MFSGDNVRKRAMLLVIAGGVMAGAFAGPSAALAATSADTVRSSGPVNIRAGANTAAKRINGLKNGMKVTITCQVAGELVRGTVRNTTLWDKLSVGGYVSDGYVVHPLKRAAIPRCVTAAAKPVPAPKAGISASSAAFLTAIAAPARQGYREYRVPASVTMAQAILESGWGRSKLTANDKNYFGIKCFGEPGEIAIGCHTYSTQECTKAGACYTTTAVFRVYKNATDSFRDHALFLAARTRYAAAFSYTTVPDRFAAEIHKAGYATDPKYTEKLVGLMKQFDLYRYDRSL
jgi:uncharacterized protein YraI